MVAFADEAIRRVTTEIWTVKDAETRPEAKRPLFPASRMPRYKWVLAAALSIYGGCHRGATKITPAPDASPGEGDAGPALSVESFWLQGPSFVRDLPRFRPGESVAAGFRIPG